MIEKATKYDFKYISIYFLYKSFNVRSRCKLLALNLFAINYI